MTPPDWDGMDSADLVVRRWKRYGRDRLYVEHCDGTKIGHWDLLTDTGHVVLAGQDLALRAAVDDWKRGQARSGVDRVPPSPASEKRSDEVPGATGDVMTRPWVDLSTNCPGGAAREQAVRARAAAPVKTVLARVLGVHTEERAWRIGADGEVKVADQLDKAIRKDPRWRVLHAIAVGSRGSDIDHLMIGPGGVFTINTKHHPDAKIWVGGSTFLVNGARQPYIRNSRHEAQRAATLLTAACQWQVHVEGVLATVNARDVVVKSQPEGVHVIPRAQLSRWVRRLGDVLTEEQVDQVFQSARRSTSWTG